MPLFIKHLSAALMMIIALISSQTSASYIDSKTDGSIVYSLFSAPNNRQRYDMAGADGPVAQAGPRCRAYRRRVSRRPGRTGYRGRVRLRENRLQRRIR